jgi:hypothetical protein
MVAAPVRRWSSTTPPLHPRARALPDHDGQATDASGMLRS